MKAQELREKFLSFFEKKGHKRLPSVSLIPENDPTTLFTGSGMQPLVPYLLGEKHPLGKRLVNSQICFRAEDIEKVGDNRHTTFFEMLGNWSLGDYFKKEQLFWFFEFLTKAVGLDPGRLYVSVFDGDENYKVFFNEKYQALTPDVESIAIWKDIFKTKEYKEGERGFDPKVKIYTYGADKNWWSRAGAPENMPVGEIGGPDSEVFYDFGQESHKNSPFKNKQCHLNCECGRFLEIGNSVFMEYKKVSDNVFEKLPQRSVDFGGGLERIIAAADNTQDIFDINLFTGAKKVLEEVDLVHSSDSRTGIRIILDHIRASMFIIEAGVEPSNKGRGYVLRRLIRRAALYSKIANIDLEPNLPLILNQFGKAYSHSYSSVENNKGKILSVILDELKRFEKTLILGMKKISSRPKESVISGKELFDFYQTYGYPPELIKEFARSKDLEVDMRGFEEAKAHHREKSLTASKGMFKSGLIDRSEEATKLHTATHLLHGALRKILGNHVQQVGSNITPKRLRFDFTHPKPLTKEEIKKVEDLVNKNIKKNLKVEYETMTLNEAKKAGALAFFGQRYPEKVKVYSIGKFSKEVCAGPHVGFTGKLGRFMIKKEESSGAGKRRIYAVLKSYLPK